ncbi:hypothetical protein CPB86DRAFT_813258 [Serendipita vermifera]|nr:hypothetical protein CPB86DRAFT_813258 [Serendipita vermifera]
MPSEVADALFTWHNYGLLFSRKLYLVEPRSPLASAPPDAVEGVSILRPLKGLDPNMYESLETSFTQLYPKFEIIFAVADPDDPSLKIARELIEKYPHVDARITIGEQIVGVNPKINNLMEAFGTAKYDILWVIDSNAQVVPDTLARSVDSLTYIRPSKPRVGLVHHVPYAVASAHNSTIGTQLERAFLNTNHAKMYIALNTVAVESCVMGKSNLYRRSDVEKIMGTRTPIAQRDHNWQDGPALHGLPSVGRFACEDAKIGESIWHELGLSHSLSSDVVTNVLGPMTLLSYIDRRARWIRVRKHTVPAATLVEPFQECILAGLILSWAISFLTEGTIPSWVTFFLQLCIFLAIDLEVRYTITSTPFESSGERWAFIFAWLGREALAFPIWIYAMFGNHISWRGVNYRILGDGEMVRDEQGSGSKLRRLFGRGPAANGYERLATHG